VLAGCSKETEKEVEPVAQVQVAEVRAEPIQRVITAEGVLRALDQASIIPKISAPVTRFYVNRGDCVRKGQLLATLENRDLAASVMDTKGVYEQTEANYRITSSAALPDELVKAQSDEQAAREQMDAAKKLLDSREQLYRDGALARRLVDEAGVAFAQAKAQYDTARKRLESLESVGRYEEIKSAAGQTESARGKYEGAQAQLAYSEVRSPIAGVIADRPTFPGDVATPGSPLMTIVDVSSVIARVNLPPDQAAHVRIGQPAVLKSADGAVETNGRVTVVSPAIDPQSTTVEVWVQAANPGERLRPGGTVHVAIVAETILNALVVPTEALLPGASGGSVVMVLGPDLLAHQRKVQVGVRNAGEVQILSGVQAGERVVSSGGLGLQDGGKVRIDRAGTSAENPSGHE
jgi:multidrug efflux pump subunit AcrA (membrane-fusion protein)